MNNNDGTTATVDLAGAISVIGTMYDLGFDDKTDETAFWEKRTILEKFEQSVRSAERKASDELDAAYVAEVGKLTSLLLDIKSISTTLKMKQTPKDASTVDWVIKAIDDLVARRRT